MMAAVVGATAMPKQATMATCPLSGWMMGRVDHQVLQESGGGVAKGSTRSSNVHTTAAAKAIHGPSICIAIN